MDPPRPRLRWRRTWPDGSPDDFVARDHDRPRMYARIYRSQAGAQVGGDWRSAVGDEANLGTGSATTAREAALAAEAAWFARRDGCDGAAATKSEPAPDLSTEP